MFLAIPTPDIPNWVILAGAALGSAVSGYAAHKAKNTSKENAIQVSKVVDELEGPGSEPSLRAMVRETTAAALEMYTKLHDDHKELKDTVTRRMDNLEKSDVMQGMTAVAVKSLENRITDVGFIITRLGMNMHKVANHVQCQLYTQEECAEILEKRAAEEKAAQEAGTKIP